MSSVSPRSCAGGETSLSLTNGTWDFLLMGWNSNNMTGTAKCFTTQRTLSGTALVIDAPMTVAGCSNNMFPTTHADATTGVRALKLHNCVDFSGITDATQNCEGFNRGFNRSFKIHLLAIDEVNASASSILHSSACLDTPTGEGALNTGVTLPPQGIPVVVTGWSGSGCTGNTWIRPLTNGVTAANGAIFQSSGYNSIYFADEGDDAIVELGQSSGSVTEVPYAPVIVDDGNTTEYIFPLGNTMQGPWASMDLSANSASVISDTFTSGNEDLPTDLQTVNGQLFYRSQTDTDISQLYTRTIGGSSTPLTTHTMTAPSTESGVLRRIIAIGSTLYYGVISTAYSSGTLCKLDLVTWAEPCQLQTGSYSQVKVLHAEGDTLVFMANNGSQTKLVHYNVVTTNLTAQATLSGNWSSASGIEWVRTFRVGTTTYSVVKASSANFGMVQTIAGGASSMIATAIEDDPEFPTGEVSGNYWVVANDAASGMIPHTVTATGITPINVSPMTFSPSANNTKILGHIGSTMLFASDHDNSGVPSLFAWNGTNTTLLGTGTMNLTKDSVLVSGGLLYFSANFDGEGREPWVTDGTTVTRLANIYPSTGSSVATSFRAFNGHVYFTADDGGTSPRLWRTDGTVAGTATFATFAGTSSSSHTGPAFATSNYLYFVVFEGTDKGLYRTDGTTAGTVQVFKGTGTGTVSAISFNWQTRIHFMLNDNVSGTLERIHGGYVWQP